MTEVKVFCNRCGQECTEGSTFYTIDIYGHDIKPSDDGRIAFDAYSQNFNTNLAKMLKQERHYCKKCKNEIEAFMKGKNEVTIDGAQPIHPIDDSMFKNLKNRLK